MLHNRGHWPLVSLKDFFWFYLSLSLLFGRENEFALLILLSVLCLSPIFLTLIWESGLCLLFSNEQIDLTERVLLCIVDSQQMGEHVQTIKRLLHNIVKFCFTETRIERTAKFLYILIFDFLKRKGITINVESHFAVMVTTTTFCKMFELTSKYRNSRWKFWGVVLTKKQASVDWSPNAKQVTIEEALVHCT